MTILAVLELFERFISLPQLDFVAQIHLEGPRNQYDHCFQARHGPRGPRRIAEGGRAREENENYFCLDFLQGGRHGMLLVR